MLTESQVAGDNISRHIQGPATILQPKEVWVVPGTFRWIKVLQYFYVMLRYILYLFSSFADSFRYFSDEFTPEVEGNMLIYSISKFGMRNEVFLCVENFLIFHKLQ